MSEQKEVPDLKQTTRDILKPIQAKGVGITIDQGEVIMSLPENESISSDNEKSLATYLNSISSELSGVNESSAKAISSTLEGLKQDPKYSHDMIMHSPSLEDDLAKARMERLANARKMVTEAQMKTQPGPERVQAIKAATFARTHLPDLGLATTINFLNAVR
jgi:hypothetical protein